MVAFVLSPLGPGQLLLVNGIAIPVIGKAAFFSLSSASGRKVGPGFRPETASAAACGKPDALLAPPTVGKIVLLPAFSNKRWWQVALEKKIR